MTTKNTFALAVAITGILSALAINTHAAPIIWGAPQNITGDSDVSTTGGAPALLGAFNVGDTGVPATGPINGVNFLPFALPSNTVPVSTTGNFTIQTTDTIFVSSNSLYGSGAGSFAALPNANYRSLLRSGSETTDSQSLELTMTGLLVGAQYEFQWWANFSGIGSVDHSAVNPGGAFVDLLDNVTGMNGGLGQYAIGTFTADNSFESVTFLSGPDGLGGLLNGFQLRQTVIPEPTTALFGMALVGVCFARRNRSSAKKMLTA